MKLYISTRGPETPREIEINDEDEVIVELRCGRHYSALWSLFITLDQWNGVPRIKYVETKDDWSDR